MKIPKEKTKVSREKAVEELERWLNAKKITGNKRKSNEDIEEELIDAIEEGYLVLNEDNSFTYKLKFPLDGENPITELKFAFRVKIGVLNAKLRGIKIDDLSGRIQTYIAVLTDQPKGLIGALDTSDNSIASAIATYFF